MQSCFGDKTTRTLSRRPLIHRPEKRGGERLSSVVLRITNVASVEKAHHRPRLLHRRHFFGSQSSNCWDKRDQRWVLWVLFFGGRGSIYYGPPWSVGCVENETAVLKGSRPPRDKAPKNVVFSLIIRFFYLSFTILKNEPMIIPCIFFFSWRYADLPGLISFTKDRLMMGAPPRTTVYNTNTSHSLPKYILPKNTGLGMYSRFWDNLPEIRAG